MFNLLAIMDFYTITINNTILVNPSLEDADNLPLDWYLFYQSFRNILFC